MVHQPLQPPSGQPFSSEQRRSQIDRICDRFVARGAANKTIYRILLECLFPPDAGIPGPPVTEREVREAVEANYKPGYKDVFRRMRELQGEEGLTGIIKQGTNYQLIHLAVGAKREPRRPVSRALTLEIALEQGNRCQVCSEPISIDGASVDEADHRVPRIRGGSSHRSNLQVVCRTCNNAKSTQCSNCTLDCNTCGWAFPEQYRPVKLRPDILLRLNNLASDRNQDVDQLANSLLDAALGHGG